MSTKPNISAFKGYNQQIFKFMKTLNRFVHLSLFFFLSISTISLISCDQDTDSFENESIESIEELRTLPMGRGDIQASHHFDRGLGGKCATLVYPVTLIFPDQNTALVNTDEELHASLRDWYENNTSDQRPTFEFPVTFLVDDLNIDVNNEDELVALFEDCRPDRPRDDRNRHRVSWIKLLQGDCFGIDFPVTINFPDGTSTSVNTAEELVAAMRDWRDTVTDSLGRPTLEFPITVFVRDRSFVVNSNEELRRAARLCVQNDHPGPIRQAIFFADCMEVEYPITVLFPDGTSQTVNDELELKTALRDWHENGQTDFGRPTLEFPINITIGDRAITLNSMEDLKRAARLCRDHNDGPRPCFKINYPISMESPDGSIVSVENNRERRMVIKQWRIDHPDSAQNPTIQFPITITLPDRTEQTINSAEELEALREDCN